MAAGFEMSVPGAGGGVWPGVGVGCDMAGWVGGNGL